MNVNHNVQLTSSEISPLWGGYIGDTMAKCVLDYFLAVVKDSDVKPIIEFALRLAEEHLHFMKKLFQNEKFPIPHGFSDQDVDTKAPRLFSDGFMLVYLLQMSRAGLSAYTMGLSGSARMDIREFMGHNLQTAADLYNRTTSLLESKGLFIRAPYIAYPKSVEYVHKESWMNGFWGDRRPLNAAEITHIHLNTVTNTIGKALMIGFSQVSRSKEIKDFLVRGRDISAKHLEVLSSLLGDDNLPAPMTWDTEVSDSTTAPFSDKLLLFHTLTLSTFGIGNYGAASAASGRRDLVAVYSRLTAEAGTYSDDGAELMVRNGWMEKLPGAIERDALVKS
jgi:hypothetical protein